jgi:serine kinase of HPr protein (carbohydrate metabolism regulator)
MTIPSSETLHASTVAIGGAAVLITGRSGSGKSDLALRLIDRGAMLVSDDYTILTRSGDALLASAPSTIRGKMEIRGVGLIETPCIEHLPVRMIVALGEPAPRLPEERERRMILGIPLPVVPLSPFEQSAPIKLERALKLLMRI